jgi:hypothetical protein
LNDALYASKLISTCWSLISSWVFTNINTYVILYLKEVTKNGKKY